MNNDQSNEQSYQEMKKNLINRLNKIEGQVRGLQKMVDEERECMQILEQLASARSSLDSVGVIIVGCALHTSIKSQIEAGEPKDVVVYESMKPFLKKFFTE